MTQMRAHPWIWCLALILVIALVSVIVFYPRQLQPEPIAATRIQPISTSSIKPGRSSAPAKRDSSRARLQAEREALNDRIKQAREWISAGRHEEALHELLWCYEEGVVGANAPAKRNSIRLNLINLSRVYPPALDVLKVQRDKFESALLEGKVNQSGYFYEAFEFGYLNVALNDKVRTLALYDVLPPDDPRRGILGLISYDDLVGAQRYSEAANSKSVTLMIEEFNALSQGAPLSTKDAPSEFCRKMALNIETLAGVGDIESARVLKDKLLAVDASPAVIDLLKSHLTRSGHANAISVP